MTICLYVGAFLTFSQILKQSSAYGCDIVATAFPKIEMCQHRWNQLRFRRPHTAKLLSAGFTKARPASVVEHISADGWRIT